MYIYVYTYYTHIHRCRARAWMHARYLTDLHSRHVTHLLLCYLTGVYTCDMTHRTCWRLHARARASITPSGLRRCATKTSGMLKFTKAPSTATHCNTLQHTAA